MPTCVGEARRIVLDQLGNRYHRHFADAWEFVRFAKAPRLTVSGTMEGPAPKRGKRPEVAQRMAWERGYYYYRTRKEGGRVVREDVGAAPSQSWPPSSTPSTTRCLVRPDKQAPGGAGGRLGPAGSR
jgi:hypothetical protein